MKLSDVMQVLTSGELEQIKQAYRQGYDWRKKLHAMRPPADTDDAAHYAKLDEIAAAATGHALAGQFVTAANSIGCVSSEQVQSCTKEGELR